MIDTGLLSFWLNRWKAGKIGFHQMDYEPLLLKHFSGYPKGTVLVPLCGKSLDLIWLAEQGHEVLGIEISPLACEAFFVENFPKVQPKKTQRGNFTAYEHGRVTLLCGDFFSLQPEQCSAVTAVYDRAALIALPADLRQKYVIHLKRLMAARSVPILLVTLEYPEGIMQPPPYSVNPAEVTKLYSDSFTIKHVDQENVATHFGVVGDMFQHGFWLEKDPLT